MSEHMVLAQYGTKRLEFNLLDGEYIVFNGDVLIWQGSDEEDAANCYNQEHSGIGT